MGAIDKAKDKAQEVAGKGKQVAGDVTGDDSLKAEDAAGGVARGDRPRVGIATKVDIMEPLVNQSLMG